jgi:hypothetical protein
MTKDELIARFETGDQPTGADFRALIEFFLTADFENWPDVLPAASAKYLTEIQADTTINEWIDVEQAVGYLADDELVLSSDLEATFLVGRRVRLTIDSGFTYSEVLTATYNGGTNATTVVLADEAADPTISDIDVAVFKPVDDGGAVGLGTLGGTAYASTLLTAADAPAARVILGEGAGGTPFTLLHTFDALVAPTVNDDEVDGYDYGSVWLDTVGKKQYVCVDPTATAAVWLDQTPFRLGDRTFWQQTTPNAGFEKDVSISANSALRLVTGGVSSRTGGQTFTATFATNKSASSVTLSAGQSGIQSHNHPYYYRNIGNFALTDNKEVVHSASSGTNDGSKNTGSQSASASSSHAHATDLDVNYYDATIGQKL